MSNSGPPSSRESRASFSIGVGSCASWKRGSLSMCIVGWIRPNLQRFAKAFTSLTAGRLRRILHAPETYPGVLDRAQTQTDRFRQTTPDAHSLARNCRARESGVTEIKTDGQTIQHVRTAPDLLFQKERLTLVSNETINSLKWAIH